MTELQPTEIELTGKKKKIESLSKRKIIAFILVLFLVVLIAIVTAVLAHRASRTPEIIQPQPKALPAEEPAPAAAPAK